MLNVVVLNGGRGAATLIPALLVRQGLNITSVVNAYDDGKSTGEIRRFFGMLGPSDIRKVQELMLPKDDPYHHTYLKLFRYRYSKDVIREEVLSELISFATGKHDFLVGNQVCAEAVCAGLRRFLAEFLSGLSLIERVKGEIFNFSDCSIMNCIFAGAFLAYRRNIESATQAIDRLFRLRGTVLPTSIENKNLVALCENGEVLCSEAEIVELRSNLKIERVYLLDERPKRQDFNSLSLAEKREYLEQHSCFVGVSPSVRSAVAQADIIVYAAGTQHSSLYPTYLATGLANAIAANRYAMKVFVTNIGADYETPQYKASDYVMGCYKYLRASDLRDYSPLELISKVLVNKSNRKSDNSYVAIDNDKLEKLQVEYIVDDFESSINPGKHDGDYLVKTILNLYDSFLLVR